MLVRPGRPLLGEVVEHHVGESLAIVAHHLRVAIHKLLNLVFQPVSPAPCELVEERRCPVGTIHLITVVEESVRIRRTGLLKSLLDMLQVMRHGG